MTSPAAQPATPSPLTPDPKLDLVLERVVDVPPERVWAAWTTPEQLKQWFTPAPWTTVDCELELEPNRRFVWTGALAPGFRPLAPAALAEAPFLFTAAITLEPHGEGTRYTALAIHADESGAAKHADMGFHQGWGAALDQLVAMAKRG